MRRKATQFTKPSIRIRYGAAHNEVIVNGTTLDWGNEPFGGLGREGRGKARGMIVGHLKKCGFFGTHGAMGAA